MGLISLRKPVQVRALELAKTKLGRDANTPEGRYILGRLEPRARQAAVRQEKKVRAAFDPKFPDKKEWKKLRDEADDLFSKFIRRRDTKQFSTAGARHGYCVTCGNYLEYASLECGHWISRAKWGTRWDPRNAHAQCAGCNKWGGGRVTEHEAAIKRIHGEDAPDQLGVLAKLKAAKPTLIQLRGIVNDLKEKIS